MVELKQIINNKISTFDSSDKFKCSRCGYTEIAGFLPVSYGCTGKYGLAPYCKECLKMLLTDN